MKDRIKEIGISGIRSFTALCSTIDDMLYLTIGEPDFDTPELIKDAAKKALDQNLTHYPPALGIDALRERIAEYESSLFNENITKDNVIITNGATEGLVLSMWTLLGENEAIIQPTPGYTLYKSQAHIAHAKTVEIDISKNNFQIDEDELRELVTENTKAILLTSPNNPTGQILNKDSIDAVASVMRDNPHLHAILDDVYDVFVYDTKLHSLREYEDLRDRLIVIQAFSKSHAMTGWRIGYVVAPTDLIDEMHKLHQNLMAGVNSIAQHAALKAFDVDNTYMSEEYKKRRDYVYTRLVDMGFDVLKPEGAFYIFPSIEKFNMTSYDFALKCAKEAKVAMIPGVYFGQDNYVRLSYCYS
ncbi:MAG TPA: aminotransferase class I/II-fold pyridoxal phosphate-dependent enzyme, partial [Erysipelothrix sp.]|nr:aminotransferase class I/II-fold pyridoxal phosphate-dependent enzyme [Erysipelothrix sp.]